MEYLELVMDESGKSAKLSIPNPTDENKEQAIDGFFGLFGVNVAKTIKPGEPLTGYSFPHKIPELELTSEPIDKLVKEFVPSKKAEPGEKRKVISPLTKKSSPKKEYVEPIDTRVDDISIEPDPVVYSTKEDFDSPFKAAFAKAGVKEEPKSEPKKTTTPVQADIDGKPFHHVTGYKIGKHHEKLYKCRYRCPNCKAANNAYIPDGTPTIECYDCKTEMDVKKACPKKHGLHPDKFNNWFIAGEQYPCNDN